MSEITEQTQQPPVIASHGSSRLALKNTGQLDLFVPENSVGKNIEPGKPVLERVKAGRFFSTGKEALRQMLKEHKKASATTHSPAKNGTSAGKNTYTYDAQLTHLRRGLYTTECRECGKTTEILYTVWSYQVICPHCQIEFRLWDHCRQYGSNVREHKILSELPCPNCKSLLKKSRLSRTVAEPVMLGYKCCDKVQREHPLNETDIKMVQNIEANPPLANGFYPKIALPDGVNLNQPKRHGFDRVDKLYTSRNLAALSHLWKEIHRLENDRLASMLAFVFTSLYQRVTRLAEFRFWGGSGNTAHFNVPFIFNEANVFVTFERKAANILDHLQTTAQHYRGNKVVVCNSATRLDYLPDNSIDFIFTDPPFGANINYSEMNILWESWLGEFTDNTSEAIVNKAQGKGLEEAVRQAGFIPEQINIFDKQHGTFKQFVSENTAGSDLVLHCRKPASKMDQTLLEALPWQQSITQFFEQRTGELPVTVFLHVARDSESDYRTLFSEWVGFGLLKGHQLADFANFRAEAEKAINKINEKKS